jgi:hypothetical protein
VSLCQWQSRKAAKGIKKEEKEKERVRLMPQLGL